MEKHGYGIGLDIGIASVGWAVLALNENAEPYGIIDCNARTFEKAEQPKGESLAAPRREARGARRRTRRRALRKADLYALLEKSGLPGKAEIEQAVQQGNLSDVYELRVRALDERVEPMDFARILLHLMQRRGFKSNRKADEIQKEGRMLQAIDANERRMKECGYRTVGEMLYKDAQFSAHKRNKAENYLATVKREQIEAEAVQIYEAQRRCGAVWATPEMEAEYLSILTRQRSFDEGPGEGSPYGGNIIEKNIGRCTLEGETEIRAAKATWSFEYYTLLQRLNHIRILNEGTSRKLTQEEREKLLSVCYKTDKLEYARIRKELELPEQARFNTVRYCTDQQVETAEKKEKIVALPCYHKLRKAMDSLKKGYIRTISREKLDAAATALTLYKNETTLRSELANCGFEPLEIEAILTVPGFSGFGHISIKACRKLIPYLEQGLNYSDACKAAGYDFQGKNTGEKQSFLPAGTPEIEGITNPVVRRAVSQTIKVVNAIIREQKAAPVWLHLELARDIAKTKKERDEQENEIKKHTAENERLMQKLRELFPGRNLAGQDLVKYRLWKEQNKRCAYSLQALDLQRVILESGYAEVDHIVPYSISMDDRLSNKVLVFAAENRQKRDHLPLEYLQGQRKEDFIVYTSTNVRSTRKRQNLLKKQISAEERRELGQRSLQDTQYISRFMLNFIQDNLAFAPHPAAGKKRVVAVNGAATAFLRKRWGIAKVRADGDLHHAADAAVIACTTDGLIQRVTEYYKRKEIGTVRSEHFPEPWLHFRDELVQRLSACPQENLMKINPLYYAGVDIAAIRPPIVSRMPRRKATGSAHDETVRGRWGETMVVSRKPITSLKLDSHGEIKDYFRPESDRLLYQALKERLQAFGNNGEKAFAEPFFKPRADGTPGAQVRKVKICEKANNTVAVHGGTGAAANPTMVRVDVYCVPQDGYYFVPIYVPDTKKPELPNKAVVANKSKAEWKEMQEENFLFSLYKNDLIYLETREPIRFTVNQENSTLEKEITQQRFLAYFKGANISKGSIVVTTPENAYTSGEMGFKRLRKIQKYQVDVLGHCTLVKKEARQCFPVQRRKNHGVSMPDDRKSGQNQL